MIPIVYTLMDGLVTRFRRAPERVPEGAPAPVSGASNGEAEDRRDR